ncbi:MAG TPA: hypothetical protein PKV55_13785 [Nitrospira sp.]|jgi:hypothetical protein|nr:hypothetical protein [Nitrospira sp.]MCC7473085.1 hypothetical protein [Candidatus Nomurabacteria bacterium]MBS0162551.1 hypothetical protein [Nitrospira sp.]MBS0173374.1 hypothetical protein [Nitrospira sp.]MBX3336519.1 hypothetical protein [Nitrospira sp.]
MPVYFLGALTLLILVIAVWATLVDDEDGMEVEQYEPKWEPLTEEPGYRKAS